MASAMGRPRGVVLPGLRDARMRRLWTQRQLAAEAGISAHVANRAENGERVSVTTAQKLAAALRVRPEALLGPAPGQDAQGKALAA